MSRKIKHLIVSTPQGEAGELAHESRYVFNYNTTAREREISLTMPLRAESYASGALPPVISMNRPEGWLQQRIVERMSKHMLVDDMRLLSVVGGNQIGRLSFNDPLEPHLPSRPTIGLNALIKNENSREMFAHLVDQYLESGISGVQPKVLVPNADNADKVPDDRATMVSANLIVKSAGTEYPFLAVNEFLCMEAARRAGIDVPKFWLSQDGGLFILERFDIRGAERLGFEDMAVLMGKIADPHGRYKYEGSYENIAKAISMYCHHGEAVSGAVRFFEYVAFSVMVRNGDAHLKNFGLLYAHPAAESSPTLAPLYDVVTTAVYDDVDRKSGRTVSDRTLALKLNKSTNYPLRETLLHFGAAHCHVRNPSDILDRIGTALTETLREYPDLAPREFMDKLAKEWAAGRESLEPVKVFARQRKVPD